MPVAPLWWRLTAYAPTVVTVWLVIIGALAVVRFWDYWSTLMN